MAIRRYAPGLLRPRFSLRTLLAIATVAAAIAAFAAVRSQPARVAQQFQDAVQRGDTNAAATMMNNADIAQTLGVNPGHSWEFESFDFSPQSVRQWLQGDCMGQLVITSHGSSESHDAIWSVIETWHCDVAAAAQGVRVLKFAKDEPLVAGIPRSPFETDAPEQPTRE